MIEGFNWQDFDSVESTNDEVKKIGGPAIITAKIQTKGRGRRGNPWQSPEGNLFASVGIYNRELNKLPFLISLSLLETIETLEPNLDIKLKWPNDVLLNNKKLSGILLEKGEGDFVIIGIGVNINITPDVPNSASLKDSGIEIDRIDFLRLFMKFFNANLSKDFARIRESWLSRAKGLNEEIKVNFETNSITGIFAGLEEDGALRLKINNEIKKIYAGEVFFKKE